MLIEFFGENFGCFRDEFRLSMLATDVDPDSERGTVEVEVKGDDEPLRLLRAAALYGPNASGKSTVVRAADALRGLLSNSAKLTSDAPLEAYEPFLLGSRSTDCVRLGLTAVVGGAVYAYRVGFLRDAVQHEALERISGKAPELFFERDGKAVRGQWTDDPQFGLIAHAFRPNALLLSLADAFAPKLAGDIAVGLRTALVAYHDSASLHQLWASAVRAASVPAFRDWLDAQLRAADVGIVGLRAAPAERNILAEGITPAGSPSVPTGRDPTRSVFFELLHGTGDRPVALPLARESSGTKRLIALAPLFYDLLHSERALTAFVDGLDASLHPTLLQGLLQHFNSEARLGNVRGQLIFTANETGLLDHEAKEAVLRRDQVYFTEKRADGSARLYSLAEFKERNNLNIRRRYLQGRYGAIPAVARFED